MAQEAADEVAADIEAGDAPPAAPLQALIDGAERYFAAMAGQGRARLLLLEAPAVLPPAQLLALHERAGARALRDGLGAALAPAALAGAVIDALAAQLSAAFDRAALAIARGEPAEPQRQAMRWLLTQLVQGAGAAPRA